MCFTLFKKQKFPIINSTVSIETIMSMKTFLRNFLVIFSECSMFTFVIVEPIYLQLVQFQKGGLLQLNIKHKVAWFIKFVKTTSLSSHKNFLLSTTNYSGKIKLHMAFSLIFFFFLSKPKFNCFKKYEIFFILTSSTNIKIRKAKFEAGCSYKDCNQFLL